MFAKKFLLFKHLIKHRVLFFNYLTLLQFKKIPSLIRTEALGDSWLLFSYFSTGKKLKLRGLSLWVRLRHECRDLVLIGLVPILCAAIFWSGNLLRNEGGWLSIFDWSCDCWWHVLAGLARCHIWTAYGLFLYRDFRGGLRSHAGEYGTKT